MEPVPNESESLKIMNDYISDKMKESPLLETVHDDIRIALLSGPKTISKLYNLCIEVRDEHQLTNIVEEV